MRDQEPWYVYILCCVDGSLYTGVARDCERRLHEHNHTAAGARYTRGRRPVSLVYVEEAPSRSAACSRECQIKRMSRQQKKRLISQVD